MKRPEKDLHLHLTTLEGFTTMVANEGLEKAEPMNPGPPGPTALHPLRRSQGRIQGGGAVTPPFTN